jgi:integrase
MEPQSIQSEQSIDGSPKLFAEEIRYIHFPEKCTAPNGLMYFQRSLRQLRKRTAQKMQNPNLNRVTFHTLHHWFATVEYNKTKSHLHVQERLGHKSVLTTTIYTHLINFEADSYNSETAQTVEDAKKLVEAGFEYVCDVDGFKLFRKLK